MGERRLVRRRAGADQFSGTHRPPALDDGALNHASHAHQRNVLSDPAAVGMGEIGVLRPPVELETALGPLGDSAGRAAGLRGHRLGHSRAHGEHHRRALGVLADGGDCGREADRGVDVGGRCVVIVKQQLGSSASSAATSGGTRHGRCASSGYRIVCRLRRSSPSAPSARCDLALPPCLSRRTSSHRAQDRWLVASGVLQPPMRLSPSTQATGLLSYSAVVAHTKAGDTSPTTRRHRRACRAMGARRAS